MSTARFVALLTFAVVLFWATWVPAATSSLAPTADATVSSAHPANNYGGAGSFAVSAPGLPKGEFQTLLQFELSAAKAQFDGTYGAGGWILTSASLQLTLANPNNPLFNSSAAGQIELSWLQNDGWSEGVGTPNAPGVSGVTWNSLASLLSPADQPLAHLSFHGGTSGSVAIPLALGSGFVADTETGSLLSLRLYAPAGETGVSGLFNSRSFGTVANRPVLTLEAAPVPEPGMAALLMAGVAGLIFRLGRRTSTSDAEVHHE